MSIPSNEIWRKSLHIAGVFFVPLLLWNREIFTGLLAVFLVIYLLVELGAKKGFRIPWLSALTDHCKRPGERGRLATGALCLAAAGISTPYLFGARAAAIGLLQVFVADTISALTGIRWGRKKLPYNPDKSWVGSLVFLITAIFISRFFVPWPEAVLLATVGAILESLPCGDWDNLIVPLAVGLVAKCLGVPS